MIKFRTKMLSVLLAIVMFVTFVPNSVYAAMADLISENAAESTLENDSFIEKYRKMCYNKIKKAVGK